MMVLQTFIYARKPWEKRAATCSKRRLNPMAQVASACPSRVFVIASGMDPTQPDQMTATVAANLRRLRAEHRLSLEDLAQQSGVSRTMLHQIESLKSTPTIALVWKIANGLGVPFSELITGETKAGLVVLKREQAKLLFNAEQTFSSRALFPFDGVRRTAEFYELRIKPGGSESADAHATGTQEHLVLVTGEQVTVTLNGQTATLRPHDAVVFTADVPHSYRNDSATAEALLYLMMVYQERGG